MSQGDYVLSDSAAEFERLRLQAHVWEPETEAWLDRLGSMEEGAFVADRLRP